MTGEAGQSPEAYQVAAHEVWRDGEATGLLRLNVISESMRPLLRRGDRVVVQPGDPHTLQPGAVIVVQRRWRVDHAPVGDG